MLLDAMMQEDEESEINYAKLKEKAQDRETWHHWERTCLRAENTGPDLFIAQNVCCAKCIYVTAVNGLCV